MKDKIIKVLVKITGTPEEKMHLEIPEREEFGDYSSNIAMTRGRADGPRKYAESLIEKLKKDKNLSKVVDRIEVAGPGFINFYLSKQALFDVLVSIKEQSDMFGTNNSKKGKKVIVEYSSPNIAKPFTIGHLRSTIIGDAIANLLEATGYTVYRDNHLGDWGTQFGKQIYAVKTWGDLEKIKKSENPVKELVALYVKFHEEAEKDAFLDDNAREWFKKLEGGDHEARDLWQKCVDWSWVEFEKIYTKLGVVFSNEFNGGRGLGEAFFEVKMKPVIKELEKQGLLKVGEEGAKLVFFKNDKYPPAMILKKDGATLYHTRDLATDKYRKEYYNPDLIVNEVGVEQTLYFQQLFEIEKLLGWYKDGQRVHIAHGLYRDKEGKMSTRKGNVIWMEDVLNQAENKAFQLSRSDTYNVNYVSDEVKRVRDKTKKRNSFEYIHTEKEAGELAKIIGIGALKYNDLKRDPKTEIIFDWNEILNMQGNSGPYIQYTYARCMSVINKALGNNKLGNRLVTSAYSLVPNSEEQTLLRTLNHFPEVVQNAANNFAPNLLCNYIYDLAQKFNGFYNKHGILEQRTKNKEQSEFRTILTSAAGQVLKNGLSILGIQAPQRM